MVSVDEYRRETTFAALPRTTRGLPLVLNVSPDATKLLYCNGNSVFIRDIESWKDCDIYTEHSTLTTVAKYSPSGFYIASGDQSGKIRIWDATQPTHILKAEYGILSGAIRDISWSDDSKRIAIVGEGRDRFGHVFLFDTGTSNGNLSGQSRPCSSIDFRPARPYRLVSGSEDYSVAIFEGPPFKFKMLFHSHSRFVHCVRYNHDGTLFASAGADGKVIIYEGVEGEERGTLVDENCDKAAHLGSVFGLSWSPDDQRIATASGDKTIKIWNVSEKKLERTIVMGSAIEDQQLSIVWAKNVLISVNLAGFLQKLDPDSDKVIEVIRGHNKPITSLVLSHDRSFAFTADFEGNITRWNLSSGMSERLIPIVHKSQIVGMLCFSDGLLVSIGWDDSIAFTEEAFDEKGNVRSTTIKLSSQPRGLAASSNAKIIIVACQKSIVLLDDKKLNFEEATNFEPTAIAMKPDTPIFCVGGQDSKIRLFSHENKKFLLIKELVHSGMITSMNWSPSSSYLVVTDAARKVVPYLMTEEFKVASEKDWTFHSARVTCCAFSICSRYIATGGIDTNIIIWDLNRSGEHPIIIKGAHPMNPVNALAWIGPNVLLSVGQDSVLKIWTIKL